MKNQEEQFECAGALGDERIRLFYVIRNFSKDIGNPKTICTQEEIETAAGVELERRAIERYRVQLIEEYNRPTEESTSLMTYDIATLVLVAYLIF